MTVQNNIELRIQNKSNMSVNSHVRASQNNVSAFSQQSSAKKTMPFSAKQMSHPKIIKPHFYDQESVRPISFLDLSQRKVEKSSERLRLVPVDQAK